MTMMRAGAYSKKFQNLEEERIKQMKRQEKTNRGKAHLYSKQTAQRQKALEDKKKAMVAAEEDRRRKALEERREAQKEATMRFRSALGRIKSTSKGHGHAVKNSKQAFLDYYLPNKRKPAVTSSKSQRSEESRERVALGRDVEVKLQPKNGYHPPRQNGLQQRAPSLDDIMGKIKGEGSVSNSLEKSHGRVIIHQRIPDMFLQQGHSIGKRSSSDSNLNDPNKASNVAKNNSDGSLSSQATSDLHSNSSDENIVFRATTSQRTNVATMQDDLRITSPDNAVSSSSESLLSNPPLTPDLNDSLNTPKHNNTVFTIGSQELSAYQAVRPNSANRTVALHTTPGSTGNVVTTSAGRQPIYVCENYVTASIDSLEDQQGTRQSNYTIGQLNPFECSTPTPKVSDLQTLVKQDIETAKNKPKLVGILKKSHSNKSRTLKKTESAKVKKVQFSDQIERRSFNVHTNRGSSNADTNGIDPARLELWKRVLPNGVTNQYLPNSAFTPKMKVSLSAKTSQSPSKPPMNGITVHIPKATNEAPLSTLPPGADSPSELQTQSNTTSVGLNGVVPVPPYFEDAPVIRKQEPSLIDTPKDNHPKQISLEKTPTDDEINSLFDQIKNALEDNQKVFVPPQVFNFKIHQGGSSRQETSTGSTTSHTSTVTHTEDHRNVPTVCKNTRAERFYSRPIDTSAQRGSQKQTNLSRPSRCQTNFSPHPPLLLTRRGHGHTVTYPTANRTQPIQMTSTEPDMSSRAIGSKKAPTSLSLEEKRLMLSIENLNKKIKDHMGRHPNAKFQSPISPEPPDFTPELYPHPPSPTPPQMHRISSTHPDTRVVNGHVYNLPKARARRKPKTTALAINPQAGEHSRTHSRGPPHRTQLFYNT